MLQTQMLNIFEQRLSMLGLRRPEALKALLRPGLGKIAQAYVEGDIDLDCDIHDLASFAESLCGPQQIDLKRRDSGNWKWWSHTRRFDRNAISHHYDVSNEFFALWLDR